MQKDLSILLYSLLVSDNFFSEPIFSMIIIFKEHFSAFQTIALRTYFEIFHINCFLKMLRAYLI